VGEAAGIGTAPATPANFKANAFDITETFHMRLARNHVLKAGFQFTSTSWTQSYTYGRDGIFQFGDLDQFGNAEGTYFRTVTTSNVADFRTTDWGLFGQDAWTVDRGIVVTIGIRWSRQKLPPSQRQPDQPKYRVQNAFNQQNQFIPDDGTTSSPASAWYGTLTRNRNGLSGPGSLSYGQLDPATLGEAVVAGGLQVHRRPGTFSSWPVNPDTVGALRLWETGSHVDSRYGHLFAKLDGAVTRTLSSGWPSA
jgi:hypothetical protein